MKSTKRPLNSISASRRFLILSALLTAGCSVDRSPEPTWWKGNLHAHSYWSDGDDYPEMVLSWYKDHGYNFIALSDHNVLADGEKWIVADTGSPAMAAYSNYLDRLGEDWVDDEERDGKLEVRLKTSAEYQRIFEEPGQFVVFRSEEITDEFESAPIHLNAINLLQLIPPSGGESKHGVLQNTVNAVLEQKRRTGRPMLVQVNHPNYSWALTPEDLVDLEGERFFEVYNGHPSVHNLGDDMRVSTERMWDVVLAERLSGGGEVMFGVAVDDAHSYHEFTSGHANPGRGWVMVRAPELSASAIVAAMEAGDFYSSTGVRLADISFADGTLSLEILPEEGVGYTTQFVGTRRGYDSTKLPVELEGLTSERYHYSDEIGVVLGEVSGLHPSYTIDGDELYVRAEVFSTKEKANPNYVGETEVAWTQPFFVRN